MSSVNIFDKVKIKVTQDHQNDIIEKSCQKDYIHYKIKTLSVESNKQC